MTNEEFDVILNTRLEKIKTMLASKGKEYGRDDRLHNFKVAGRRRNQTPERALMGMKEKHSVSLEDIIDDIDIGIIPTLELLDAKVGDEINYWILLEGLILERIKKAQNTIKPV